MIYVIGERRSGVVKIGTATDPTARLKAIQAGNHRPLQVLVSLPGDRVEEAAVHRAFADLCVGGEWFDFGNDDPVTAVAGALDAPVLPDRPPPVGPRDIVVRPVPQPSPTVGVRAERPVRIAIVGAKGGVGTSTVAMMLGFILAETRPVTIRDISATQGCTSWAEGWGDEFPLTVERRAPTRYTLRAGTIEIVDMGRWSEARSVSIDNPDVTLLVSKPGHMELYATQRALDEAVVPGCWWRPTSDNFGVLLSHVGTIGDDDEPVDDEPTFRRFLADSHPAVSVVRASIPARHSKHGDEVDYADWFGAIPDDSPAWWGGSFRQVARDVLAVAGRGSGVRVA